MTVTNTEFQNVFRKYYSQTLFYAARIVGDEEAEDVVQDTFVEYWKRREEITDEDHIRAFLYRTVYTRSLNVLKHRSITQNYAESVQQLEQERALFYRPENNDTLNNIENKELRAQIGAAIEELPDKCREVFKMSYMEDKKNKEIAESLQLSVKTVEVHIYRALKFLRQRLGDLILIFLLFLLK